MEFREPRAFIKAYLRLKKVVRYLYLIISRIIITSRIILY